MEFKKELKRLVRQIGTVVFTLQIVVFPGGITAVASGMIPSLGDEYVSDRTANILKVCALLENRIEDRQLLEKTKEKVFTLGDGQTRLLASLSDRVNKEGHTTAAGEFAFLLITALITLL